jgi:hypothetical protein
VRSNREIKRRGALLGIILRSQLLVLLKHKEYVFRSVPGVCVSENHHHDTVPANKCVRSGSVSYKYLELYYLLLLLNMHVPAQLNSFTRLRVQLVLLGRGREYQSELSWILTKNSRQEYHFICETFKRSLWLDTT